MKSFPQWIAISLSAVASAAAIATSPAQAGEWDYAVDSFNDGISGTLGGQYEFYGLGIKQVGNEVYVGLDSRFPIAGDPESGIAWGDLIFNFSGSTLGAANGNLLGIRFATNNDAGVSGTGVFGGVTAQFVKQVNGFASMADYTKAAGQGGSPSMGDLSAADPYFNGNYNVIGSGTKLGDIDLLDSAALAGLGFSLPNTGGAESDARGAARSQFGFKFQLPDEVVGKFVAHVFAECLNDGVAIAGEFKKGGGAASTPEPMAALGLAGVATIFAKRRRSNLA